MNDRFETILAMMPTTSAWKRGVKETARDMLESMDDNGITNPTETDLLNGAQNWHEWAWGGCGLIYDTDIAERYCSPSELRKVRGGERSPNSSEQWLDVETRAAHQAAAAIVRLLRRLAYRETLA